MRAFIYATALLLATGLTANAETSQCSAFTFELSEQCLVQIGLGDRLSAFKHEVEVALKLYGVQYSVRVHVFDYTSGSEFRGTEDDVFSMTVTDKSLKPVGEDIYIKRAFLAQVPEILLEYAARHELAHALNGDIRGFRPNGANTEEAAEHRVLELVGERRYREYVQAYFSYHGQSVNLDAFVKLVQATIPRSD